MSENIKKIEELMKRLSEKETQLEMFFNSSKQYFCIASTNGYFVKVNKAWVDRLGWTEDELCSNPWLFFVHPDDVEKTKDAAAVMSTDPVTKFRNRYRCKDGSYRTILWNVPIWDPEGYAACVGMDSEDVPE